MGSLVGTEVGAVTEAFATVKTSVGLLPCVGLLVSLEVEVPTEASHICVTFVGFLCEVQALMVNEFF